MLVEFEPAFTVQPGLPSKTRHFLRAGYLLTFCLVVFLLAINTPGRGEEPPEAKVEFFEKEVRPLLVEKCQGCHGEVRPKGRLKLTSLADILQGGDNGPAIVPGKPDESLLVKAVRYHDEPRMPPKGKLADKQIEILERWVKQGAIWP